MSKLYPHTSYQDRDLDKIKKNSKRNRNLNAMMAMGKSETVESVLRHRLAAIISKTLSLVGVGLPRVDQSQDFFSFFKQIIIQSRQLQRHVKRITNSPQPESEQKGACDARGTALIEPVVATPTFTRRKESGAR